MNKSNNANPLTSKEFVDNLIRLAIVAVVLVMCLRIFSPFINLMLWALILGVTLDPLNDKLAARLGTSPGKSATVMVTIGVLLLLVPSVVLGTMLLQETGAILEAHREGTMSIRGPSDKVAEWPIIGERVYTAWTAAAGDITSFVEANRETVASVVSKGAAIARSIVGDLFVLIGALIVAGIMMAYGEGGSTAMKRIMSRIAGEEHGPEIHDLSVKTTRSVAVGVLGVAAIQALVLGIGLVLAGIPMPGALTLIALLLAIMQLPGLIIGLPIIIWMWQAGDGSTVMNVVWTIYIIAAGLLDNFLKPLLLGRGVDVPMTVVLLGALGGLVSAGFIGLFIGAVILSVGYQVFMKWVDESAPPTASSEESTEGSE